MILLHLKLCFRTHCLKHELIMLDKLTGFRGVILKQFWIFCKKENICYVEEN